MKPHETVVVTGIDSKIAVEAGGGNGLRVEVRTQVVAGESLPSVCVTERCH